MTDTQLYFAVGVPTLAVFVSMLVNGYWYHALNARMTSLEARMTALEVRMTNLEARVYAQLELLTGKIAEMDTRLSILEDRFKR